MEIIAPGELSALPDLGLRLRQLRWFRRAFSASAQAMATRYQLSITTDEKVLTKVFVNWVETIEHKKQLAQIDRADFIMFCGGLMLEELISSRPLQVLLPATPVARLPEILSFWPEGFVYTNFCISAVRAVHEQEMGVPRPTSECLDDLRTWWSFRENTIGMPAYAIAFLDRFLGAEPNWASPAFPEERAAMKQRRPANEQPTLALH